jgi:hypothetical protein
MPGHPASVVKAPFELLDAVVESFVSTVLVMRRVGHCGLLR